MSGGASAVSVNFPEYVVFEYCFPELVRTLTLLHGNINTVIEVARSTHNIHTCSQIVY